LQCCHRVWSRLDVDENDWKGSAPYPVIPIRLEIGALSSF
jgi:hypothetical protein